jgi:hypothetical protein
MGEKYEYSYSVEELDELIEKMSNGIIPFGVSEDMMTEVRMREKEMRSQLFDEDDDDGVITEEEIKEYRAKQEQQRELNKHRAHKEDIKVIKLGPKVREKVRKSVSASLVRPEVSDYVKTDEELYSSDEERKLLERVARLKSRYQNPADWRNAMNIIREYVDFMLLKENRNKSKEEIYRDFHDGKIKINISLPKLFTDFVHEITDPELLSNIANGSLVVKTSSDIDDEMIPIDYSKDETMDTPVKVMSDEQYQKLKEECEKGVVNVLTPFQKMRSSVFTYKLPSTNPFARKSNTNDDKDKQQKESINFLDQKQVDEYISKITGFDPNNPNNIINLLNEKNGRALSQNSKRLIQSRHTVVAYDTSYKQNKCNNQYGNNPMKRSVMSIYDRRKSEQSTLEAERALIESINANNYIP